MAYFIGGRVGLALDPVAGFASLMWPPAGIALAALILYGVGIWPGIAIGAFAVNATAGAPATAALAIAVGNTLEGVLGAYVLRHSPGFRSALDRVRDVLVLTVVAAGLSTTVAASIGTTALILTGVAPRDLAAGIWISWWSGDAIGLLIVAPLLLAWITLRGAGFTRARQIEAVVLALALIAAGALIFAGTPPVRARAFWQAFALTPLLIWAALRYRLRGASTAIFLIATVAIWGTTLGLGPFTGGELFERLQSLQAFIAIMAVTSLILGAVTAERDRAEDELREARDIAESANRAKSMFLAVTSHELRTPLTGIIGYADLLKDGVVGPVTESQGEQLGRIKSAAWHLVGIIDSILTFTRAEAGREEIDLESIDAEELAREIVALLEPQARAKGLQLLLRTPGRPVPMVTDPGKLRQVLVNLLGNAVKFTDVGQVRLDLMAGEGQVVFRIRDQGPGIPPNELDRIFEPFTQVDQTATRVKGGTGLGLAVAQSLTRLLGGTVSVRSQVGRGTTFYVRLPARRARPDREREPR